jgi:tetratricopeptide (TPR) repeat protein
MQTGTARAFSMAPFQALIQAFQGHQVREAVKIFVECRKQIGSLPADHPHAPQILEYGARLLDHSPSRENSEVLENLCERVWQNRGFRLPSDMARLHLAQGILAFHRQRYADAVRRLEASREFALSTLNAPLELASRDYLARAYYRRGDYDSALRVIGDADFAQPDLRETGVHLALREAWINFILGRIERAETTLDSGMALVGTDYFEQADYLSFRARIARRRGDYGRAIDLWVRAIGLYSRNSDQRHPNLGRCYAQLAFARVLLARTSAKSRADSLRQMASKDLDFAEEVYSYHPDSAKSHRGLSRIAYFRSFLYFDREDLAQARRYADRAYKTSAEGNNHVIMANSRLMAAMSTDPLAALKFVDEAEELSKTVPHARLTARVLISKGSLRLGVRDLRIARQCLQSAARLIGSDERDYLRDEFESLSVGVVSAFDNPPQERFAELEMSNILEHGLQTSLRQVEKRVIQNAYKLAGGSVAQAAKLLKTSRSRVSHSLSRDAAKPKGPE